MSSSLHLFKERLNKTAEMFKLLSCQHFKRAKRVGALVEMHIKARRAML